MTFDVKKLDEFVRKINIIIDLYNKDMEIPLGDLHIVFEGDDWFIMLAMIVMMGEKPKNRMEHITTIQVQDMSEACTCVQCGKPIKRGEYYFPFDILGCFCECCNKKNNRIKKKMSNESIYKVVVKCEILTTQKAEIIAKGTEHKSFHKVELGEHVEILSFSPIIEFGMCCLLCCKIEDKQLITIPVDWMKTFEDCLIK